MLKKMSNIFKYFGLKLLSNKSDSGKILLKFILVY